MKQQLLLLQDVHGLGVKGQIVSAKPGYVRNYLLPKQFAVVATANTLRKKQKLEVEQAAQAVIDKKESEELAMQIESVPLEITVKVDPMNRMYGSVSAGDIAQIFVERGLPVERTSILLNKAIKEIGAHKIVINLKGGIQVTCNLTILPEGGIKGPGLEKVVKPILPEDVQASEQGE